MQMIFVNLPVSDLARSRKFYEGLGYQVNEKFSDDTNICVVIEENIYFMMMIKERFATFSPNPVPDSAKATGVLNALTADSREAVNFLVEQGIKHGGRDNNKSQDYGFMYSRSVSDPDGHVLEYVWMDMAAFDKAQAASL